MTPSGIEPATFRFVAQQSQGVSVPKFRINLLPATQGKKIYHTGKSGQ